MGSTGESGSGLSGNENIDFSNANIGENPISRKSKGSEKHPYGSILK